MGRSSPGPDGRWRFRTTEECEERFRRDSRIGIALTLLMAGIVLAAVYCQVTWEMYGSPRCPTCGTPVRYVTEQPKE
jgi:hypothetical protein